MLPTIAAMSFIAGVALYFSRRIHDESLALMKHHSLQEPAERVKIWASLAGLSMGLLFSSWCLIILEFSLTYTTVIVVAVQGSVLLGILLVTLVMEAKDRRIKNLNFARTY